MKNKIGVAVITYKREELFRKCINSISNADTLIVINDGTPYSKESYPTNVKEVIQHTTNKSVGVSKNEALRYLIQDDCDHLFIIEDDIYMKDPNVFTNYIKGAEASGLWHLMYGYHGPGNIHPITKAPLPRNVVDYNGIEIAFNLNCVGAFCYYLRSVIKNVGYMDERFHNAWEHLEHSYRIVKTGLLPAYWWWPDLANSHMMIGDSDPELQQSVIRKDNKEFMKSFQEGGAWFKHKHGFYPTEVPNTPQEAVIEKLKEIHTNYAKKVL